MADFCVAALISKYYNMNWMSGALSVFPIARVVKMYTGAVLFTFVPPVECGMLFFSPRILCVKQNSWSFCLNGIKLRLLFIFSDWWAFLHADKFPVVRAFKK